jgi:uncharacterized membrane protein
MRALPTHGGTHGFATGLNNHGYAVGWAEVPTGDPTCSGRGQILGFLGAVWDTEHGDQIQPLLPLDGDSASAATAINDRGQIVGISGICDQAVGRFTARHMVVWNAGVASDLGSFGGEAWNTPMAISERGVVVGFANATGTTGGAFNERPFMWSASGGLQDLGTLAGDENGQALGVNASTQIVGLSRGGGGLSAVLWQSGAIVDLNALAPGYEGHLLYANDINNAGVITGVGDPERHRQRRAVRGNPHRLVAARASGTEGPPAPGCSPCACGLIGEEGQGPAIPRHLHVRLYRLKAGSGKEFHRVVIEQAVPLLREQGVDVVAFGPSGDDPEMYYLVRAYASIEELRALEPRSP